MIVEINDQVKKNYTKYFDTCTLSRLVKSNDISVNFKTTNSCFKNEKKKKKHLLILGHFFFFS